MSRRYPTVDPEGLLEYSVVFTDRALNHMSLQFQQVMRDIAQTLKQRHGAQAVAVLPGGGSIGMEAVARQLATAQKCLVLRHGWFSYRWSQIFAAGRIPAAEIVLKARPQTADAHAAWAPPPLPEVLDVIARERPALVFAPHVETASGILLPDSYLRALADAVHAYGGLLVVDGIASGALWLDMAVCGIDVLISAPQKVWSSAPGVALVMLSAAALQQIENRQSTSFATDLRQWCHIMQAYENGGHAYHATLPTSVLWQLRNSMQEMQAVGWARLQAAQWALGRAVRALMAAQGWASVAAADYAAPGVVVCHSPHPGLQDGSLFRAQGLQTASGVPLMCDEPADFASFRIGLFGIDKLCQPEATLAALQQAVAAMAQALASGHG